jgi:hypothetical protein
MQHWMVSWTANPAGDPMAKLFAEDESLKMDHKSTNPRLSTSQEKLRWQKSFPAAHDPSLRGGHCLSNLNGLTTSKPPPRPAHGAAVCQTLRTLQFHAQNLKIENLPSSDQARNPVGVDVAQRQCTGPCHCFHLGNFTCLLSPWRGKQGKNHTQGAGGAEARMVWIQIPEDERHGPIGAKGPLETVWGEWSTVVQREQGLLCPPTVRGGCSFCPLECKIHRHKDGQL